LTELTPQGVNGGPAPTMTPWQSFAPALATPPYFSTYGAYPGDLNQHHAAINHRNNPVDNKDRGPAYRLIFCRPSPAISRLHPAKPDTSASFYQCAYTTSRHCLRTPEFDTYKAQSISPRQ
jgi:hypothetical protein